MKERTDSHKLFSALHTNMSKYNKTKFFLKSCLGSKSIKFLPKNQKTSLQKKFILGNIFLNAFMKFLVDVSVGVSVHAHTLS